MDNRRPVSTGTPALRGRRTESALLDGVVGAVRQGESRTLLLWGEEGVGKTALLEYLVAGASDLQVVRAAGVQSEMELAFASLHQLCAPMLGLVGLLPAPQRHALEIAFGLSEGAAPDRFLVGLAVLSLFAEVTEDRPLLCVVDDAQWLDQATARTLTFAARRLLAEPVGLVFAAREPPEELRGVPDFEVRGLRTEDARALLASEVHLPLDERVRDRIVAETRGNPLALLELPRGMSATELAAGFGLVGAQALSGRIEESFLQRVEELPGDARLFLLTAAAEPVGDPLLLWSATERLEIPASAVDGAEAAELLEVGERVTFRHPLVRSAVYRSAPVQERRAVHLALAEATDGEVDPDRRAWHLAAAVVGPDEDVAVELERSAARAQARSGLAAAAAFLQRAVALTGDPSRRADRALAAAEANLHAGGFEAALGLLSTAEAGALDELQAARAALLRGQIAFASGLGSDAPSLLLEAARRLEPLELELARETYLAAFGAALFAGPASIDQLVEIARAARALPPPDLSRPVDLLLDGLAQLITEGRTAATPSLRRAVGVFAGDDISGEEGLQWGWMATAASNALWDHEGSLAIYARQIELARDAGALERLPLYLFGLGTIVAWSGDFGKAASVIAETDEVTAATGVRALPYALLVLRSLQGDDAETSRLVAATLKQAEEWGQGIAVTTASWAAAILHNGLGRYEEALAEAQRAAFDPSGLYAGMRALSELAEAAARCGRADLARDALDRLATTTEPAGNDLALGIEARTRALLSEGDRADRLYREAIDRLARTRVRPELARAHLLYGEWLRREQRRVDARVQLRAAHDQFIDIGMEAFSERARTELVATGETVRKRTVETRDDLTAQERQIAALARDGLSNPEIGARLFLSPRTVEWHLRKVFTKLGISSRKQLVRALRDPDSDLVPA